MSTKILVEVTREQQLEIETHCSKHSLSFGDYFMQLHTLNTQESFVVKKEAFEGLEEPLKAEVEAMQEEVPKSKKNKLKK